MTLLHFVNCAALSFGSCYLVYKAKLSDYGVRPIVWGMVGYLLTQLCKLILAATIYSSYTIHDESIFNWVDELSSIVLSILDVIGLQIALNRSGGYLTQKILGTGLGWATAHNLSYYGPGLWVKARSLQFSYEHIQNSITANINLVTLISFAFLAYLATAKKPIESSSTHPLIAIAIAIALSCETLIKLLKVYVGLDAWVLISVRLVHAAIMAGLASKLWSQYNRAISKH